MDMRKKDGLPPDYFVTSSPNASQNDKPHWYNRHCAMLDVKVSDRYACTVAVKLPKDNRDVEWAWVRKQAVARAKELSRIVRQSRDRYITVEVYGIVDYNGHIITENKQKNHGKINRKTARRGGSSRATRRADSIRGRQAL